MNAFFYPSNRGINFAKIRGFKVTDYTRSRAMGGYAVRSLFPVRLHSLGKNPKSPNRYHSGLGTQIILASTKSKCQRQEDMKNISRTSTFVISGMAGVTRWGSDGGDGGGRFAKLRTFGKGGRFAKVGFANMTWRCLQAG